MTVCTRCSQLRVRLGEAKVDLVALCRTAETSGPRAKAAIAKIPRAKAALADVRRRIAEHETEHEQKAAS